MRSLPIDGVVSEVFGALGSVGACVLTAPPGAGKSTRIPPALLDPRLLDPEHPQVYLLQPRRVAATGLARRIAAEHGWELGAQIGYRIRFETRGGADTRLWVQTEGTLTRQLQRDPYLEGVGAVVLDEFHERSMHVDLALAWLRELRRTVRPDLKLVVMSATMDPAPVAAFLDAAPVIEAGGTPHPVQTVMRPPRSRERLGDHVVRVLDEALAREDCGDVLVFLPGVGEIETCLRLIGSAPGLQVVPLHGSLAPEAQARAVAASGGQKVVLATNVAETSLTIEGVRTVIDSGLARVARFDPDAGLDELRLEAISGFSAAQRAGRAGRTAPGRCYRLWSRSADARRPPALDPELRRCDVTPAVLMVKALHGGDSRGFPWFEPPEAERLAGAEELLSELGFTARPFAGLSERGGFLAGLPLHPRIARLMAEAASSGAGPLGADVAAVLAERDLRPPWRRGDPPAVPGPADCLDRIDALARCRACGFAHYLREQGIDTGAARRIDAAADQIARAARRLFGDLPTQATEPEAVMPRLLVAAYPDRVGIRSANDPNSLTLVGGIKVRIEPGSALHVADRRETGRLVVAYRVQGFGGRGARRRVLQQGCEIERALLEELFPEALRQEDQLRYVSEKGRVECARVHRYRDLVIDYRAGVAADPASVAACLAAALAPEWDALIAEHSAAAAFLRRWDWLAARADAPLAPLSAAQREAVLAAWCADARARSDLARNDPLPLLQGQLAWRERQMLDEWAPERIAVSSGSRIRVDYSGERPVLAVRIQELFGARETPRIALGREAVLLHLLAPNQRPAQVTDDLASFWANTYPSVR
ncbi:MAG: ATP-dependent helicase HrpB, partial [Planctomycetota bacterium]